VVAVAMIFAVLKMEAAPYYILDEFDHALDSQFRGAIAGLIEDLS
jgi:structural maintenance of chromosome 3 (chondroitin sulfate proteoglycan 6)